MKGKAKWDAWEGRKGLFNQFVWFCCASKALFALLLQYGISTTCTTWAVHAHYEFGKCCKLFVVIG